MLHETSPGFDETVVLTDLRNHGNPQAATIIGKFDASDVVSSVRWAPSDFQLSWTTDGGDFQVVDTRVRSPQLQLPLYKFQVNNWCLEVLSQKLIFRADLTCWTNAM